MHKIIALISALIVGCVVQAQVFDDAIATLSQDIKGQVVSPKTTTELKALFKDATHTKVPRIFVDKLPADFTTEGSPELFTQVMTALVLRANEKTLRDKIILTGLKSKYDKGVEWTPAEDAFFHKLVEKYDVIVKKTIPTQLEQLVIKIDEVTPGLAVAQAAYATNWGKKDLSHPFMQMGWLDDEHYEPVSYNSLIKATDDYVQDMNAAPNYWLWRVQRQKAAHRAAAGTRLAYNMAGHLRSYLPEDPLYSVTLQQLIKNNPTLGELYNASFIEN
ncbi:MAG: hypothetical protein II942_03795 [Alphaproteobacteria bacterium]|nr:hypothetical protein [Alphaproteobacteria bacterium]